jgi:VanZ family protein
MNGNRKITGIQFLLKWLPALIMMGVIFYFSSIPSQEMPSFGSWDTLIKKSAHFFGYLILGLFFLRGMNFISWRTCFYAFLFVVLYALSDEFHQSFVPGRTSTLVDVGIDTLGALAGLLAARIFQPLGKTVLLGIYLLLF